MILINLYGGHHDKVEVVCATGRLRSFGILVTTWLGMLPDLVCLFLVIMAVIPLLEMMKGVNMRDELGL